MIMGLTNGDHVEPNEFSSYEQAVVGSSTKQRIAALNSVVRRLEDNRKLRDTVRSRS